MTVGERRLGHIYMSLNIKDENFEHYCLNL